MSGHGDMLLNGILPDSISVNGVPYEIETDFRAVLRIIDRIENGADVSCVLELYRNDIPLDRRAAAEKMLGFIGREHIPSPGAVKPYSFRRDAELIVGAFAECYGIDLTSEDMHWHRFRALFASLSRDCAFSQLVICRTAKFTEPSERLAARRILRRYGGR